MTYFGHLPLVMDTSNVCQPLNREGCHVSFVPISPISTLHSRLLLCSKDIKSTAIGELNHQGCSLSLLYDITLSVYCTRKIH